MVGQGHKLVDQVRLVEVARQRTQLLVGGDVTTGNSGEGDGS